MKKLFQKKYLKRYVAILAVMALAVILTGCSTTNAPIDPNSSNFWDKYILYNLSQFILWLSKIFGNSYGWGIIIFTFIIRLVLVPLSYLQIKSMKKQQAIQPQIEALKKKYNTKDVDTQKKLQEETQKLYAEAGINPVAGCLPLIIQLPIMMALYTSIQRTPQLQDGTFAWMQLGKPDPYYIMVILTVVFTFLSTYISNLSQPASAQNGMMKGVLYIMPIMIGFMAFSLPSAITLYWVVSNAFQVVQTFILQNPIKYRREVEAAEEAEREKKRQVRKAIKRAKRRR